MVVLLIMLGWILKKVWQIRSFKKLQLKNKEITAKALKFAFAQFNLRNPKKNMKISPDTARLADVWGSGVMAYEFRVQLNHEISLKGLRKELEAYLQGYAQNHKLTHLGETAFVISDLWQEKGFLHLDITYVVNGTTFNYLHDIKKVE
ncbi:hypothetical protein [Liquorilactobacillus oeni]|nr:hypothetical protein [Liquorilactobacillus oeni]